MCIVTSHMITKHFQCWNWIPVARERKLLLDSNTCFYQLRRTEAVHPATRKQKTMLCSKESQFMQKRSYLA
jgi:hypothetical protein